MNGAIFVWTLIIYCGCGQPPCMRINVFVFPPLLCNFSSFLFRSFPCSSRILQYSLLSSLPRSLLSFVLYRWPLLEKSLSLYFPSSLFLTRFKLSLKKDLRSALCIKKAQLCVPSTLESVVIYRNLLIQV